MQNKYNFYERNKNMPKGKDHFMHREGYVHHNTGTKRPEVGKKISETLKKRNALLRANREPINDSIKII